jgi:lipoprotein-releasing system permease protein
VIPLRLPFRLALALRWLKSTRKDSFTSFLSAVAAAGIGLGVAALILALAALSGMQRILSTEILARTPALEIALPAGADRFAAEREIARDPAVRAVQTILRGRGWLVIDGSAQPIELFGHEGAVPESFPEAAGAPPGLYLADTQARRFGLEPGAIVTLAAPRPTLTPLGPQPRLLTMRLAGLYRASRTDDVAQAAVPLERAEILLGADRAHVLQVATGDLALALDLAARLAAVLPAGSRISTWQDLNRPLFFALRLEKNVMFLAVSLVVAVAAIALFSDLSLIASAKRVELGMLAAMGAGRQALKDVFCCSASRSPGSAPRPGRCSASAAP